MIGHVTKLIGNATAIRNGVSIILNQGDNVNKGDVVQSGSDSTLGITFIDGTVFGLASNAKMVLNEMVYDPNGSDNKSLLSLVQGTISFVAGATAKNGDMKVDTPVATMGIRGTAVLVEIDFEVPGQGAAPPAKFQVLVEPDGTTGSYILFDKTTLTPIATVNRAGTQTIINGQGGVSVQSSVQLSPDAQKIITDVFSLKFSDLNNPNTKLTTNFTDSIVPENVFRQDRRRRVRPGDNSVGQRPERNVRGPAPGTRRQDRAHSRAAAGGALSGAVAERIDVTASPTLASISGIVSYADINVGDTPSVSAKFSSFAYKNAQHADRHRDADGGAIGGDHGGRSAAERGAGSQRQEYRHGDLDLQRRRRRVRLPGRRRDADADLSGAGRQQFRAEQRDVLRAVHDRDHRHQRQADRSPRRAAKSPNRSAPAIRTVDTVTGTVTFTDPDLTDRPVVSAEISATDPFRYYDAEGNDVTATLTPVQLAAILAVQVPLTVVQAAGNSHNGSATWTYSIADSAFDFIADDETLTLNYVATVDDGHGGVISTPITVSIHGADVVVVGTNDVPTIDTTSDAFAELSNVNQPNPTGSSAPHTRSGTISFTDVDLTDRPVASAAFTSYTYQNAAASPASRTVSPAPGNSTRSMRR